MMGCLCGLVQSIPPIMIGMSPSVVASHRSFVWLILIAAAAAGIGLWVGGRQFTGAQLPPLASAVMYPQPRSLPPFELSRAVSGEARAQLMRAEPGRTPRSEKA